MKHFVMELHCPGWIQSLVESKDEITAKEVVRSEFERLVEELDLSLSDEVFRESGLYGDCREFRRLSLFIKYHATYGGCGLCSKRHWLASWRVLPGHLPDELEIAEQVAKEFDRRYPQLGILSLSAEWWQV